MKAPRPKSHDPVPKGSHVARLYEIVHIGTISYEYMGEMKKSDKVRLTFELCNERKEFAPGEGEKPLAISREFGLSMGKRSKLRPFVEGILGTSLYDEEAFDFDLEELLGRECLLTVVHDEKNGNVYANILSAAPLPKGMEAPALFNEKRVIDVNTSPLEDVEALPDFLKEKVHQSEEWGLRQRAIAGEEARRDKAEVRQDEGEVDPADIPF